MKLVTIAICLLALSSHGARANDDATNDQALRALVGFVTDATTFEGMFYSVHDYCFEYTDRTIADVARQAWLKENAALLSARDEALKRMKGGLDADASEKLLEWKRGVFAKSRNSARLYKDIIVLENKYLPCSKRLGEMNSASMRFESIAPESYRYWKERGAP